MRLIWPLALNVMISLTGLSLLAGIILDHSVMEILTRSALVLIGSGIALMFMAMVLLKSYQSEQRLMVKKIAENRQKEVEKKYERKDQIAA